jgi:hypothetical protein
VAPSRLLDLGEDINHVRAFQDKTRNDRTATSTGSFPCETSPSTCSGIADFRRTSASYSDFSSIWLTGMVSNRTSEKGLCPRHAWRARRETLETTSWTSSTHRGHLFPSFRTWSSRPSSGISRRRTRCCTHSRSLVRQARESRPRSADAIRRYPAQGQWDARQHRPRPLWINLQIVRETRQKDLPKLIEGADAGRLPHSTHLASPDFWGRLGCLYRTTSPTSRPGTKTNF